MDYIELSIQVDHKDFIEILEAELSDLPFDSFQSDKLQLRAYMSLDSYDQNQVDKVLSIYEDHIREVKTTKIPHQNWNRLWESNYDPVYVGDHIVIKAPFHQGIQPAKYVITIDPNMSFGTGHHPTTCMILEAMEAIPLENKDLCDFGCGSGILSIYAALRGSHGFGIEIDPGAADAARQNLSLNQTEGFHILTGDIDTLRKSAITFDILLANINRNVIEESVNVFHEMTRTGAYLFCAGFLNEDADELRSHLEKSGFSFIHSRSRDGWTMLQMQRTT